MLEAVKDHDSINYKKSWFYFKMASNSQQKVKITIQNVNIFESVNDVTIFLARTKAIALLPIGRGMKKNGKL